MYGNVLFVLLVGFFVLSLVLFVVRKSGKDIKSRIGAATSAMEYSTVKESFAPERTRQLLVVLQTNRVMLFSNLSFDFYTKGMTSQIVDVSAALNNAELTTRATYLKDLSNNFKLKEFISAHKKWADYLASGVETLLSDLKQKKFISLDQDSYKLMGAILSWDQLQKNASTLIIECDKILYVCASISQQLLSLKQASPSVSYDLNFQATDAKAQNRFYHYNLLRQLYLNTFVLPSIAVELRSLRGLQFTQFEQEAMYNNFLDTVGQLRDEVKEIANKLAAVLNIPDL